MPSPHTWITLSDKIFKLLCDWNFEFKLTSITLDNASSIDAFINIFRTQLNLRNAFLRKGQFFHIIYCAHILNLIVQKGFKVMDESVKVRESVKYIKGSEVRKEKFKECIAQEALNNSRGLRQDVQTRWNSTYQCLIVHFTIIEHFSNWKQVIRTTNTLLMKRNETKWREYVSFLVFFTMYRVYSPDQNIPLPIVLSECFFGPTYIDQGNQRYELCSKIPGYKNEAHVR